MAVAPTYPQLRDYVLPALRKVLASLEITRYKYNKNDNVITMPNGSEIWLRSADKPSTMVGSNLAWAWLDEPGLIKDEAIAKTQARVRHPDVVGVHQIALTGSPEGMAGKFFDYAEGDPPVYPEEHPRAGERMSIDIRARSDDNPFLPEDYVHVALSGFTDEEKEAYREGRFVPPSGRVYTQFDRKRHVTPCPSPLEGELIMACDFNVDPMWWVCGRVLSGEAHFWAEIIGHNTDAIEHSELAARMWADWLMAETGTVWTPREAAQKVTVYCDAAGNSRMANAPRTSTQQLRSVGFNVRHRSKNPAVEDRIFSVQRKLADNRLFFDDGCGSAPGCPKTIKCFSEQARDQHGAPDKKSDTDHGPDAVGYAIHTLWPATRPRGNVKLVQQYN